MDKMKFLDFFIFSLGLGYRGDDFVVIYLNFFFLLIGFEFDKVF